MNRSAITLFVLTTASLIASAGVPDPAPGSIVQPAEVTTSYQQVFGDNLGGIRFSFDQSGLAVPYQSGITPFDNYLTTAHANSNTAMMVINSNGSNQSTGVVELGGTITLDLGASMNIDAVGVWMTQVGTELASRLGVHTDDDADFSNGGTVLLGTYDIGATSVGTPLGFDAVETRFVHLEVLGHGGGSFLRAGEFAVRAADRCIADLAQPFGILDLGDISAFVSGFLQNESAADLNIDGLFDLADIALFVSAFQSGCE